MTADRWWVRLGARWFARFRTVDDILKSGSLAVTAFSTFSLVLQNAGLDHLVPYVGAFAAGGFVVFTYYFSEGGVYNQAQRDLADLASNFAGPNTYIVAVVQGATIAAAIKGERLDEEELESLVEEASRQFDRHRDGIELEYEL